MPKGMEVDSRLDAGRSGWRSDKVLVLLVLWFLFIVYATLLPFDFSASGELIRQQALAGLDAAAQGGLVARCGRQRALVRPLGFPAGDVEGAAPERVHHDRGTGGNVHRGVLERLGRARPVVCPASSDVVHRPGDQLVWRDRGGCTGVAVGTPRLAGLVDSSPPVTELAAAGQRVLVTVAVVLVLSGLSPFGIKPRADVP